MKRKFQPVYGQGTFYEEVIDKKNTMFINGQILHLNNPVEHVFLLRKRAKRREIPLQKISLRKKLMG